MSRVHRLIVLSVLLAAAPAARALDSLEEVACICADDVINTGDYVSCVAHLSRRLVVKGRITNAERSEAISEASRVDYALLAEDCSADATGAECAAAGWGVSLETDAAFYSEGEIAGEPAVASAVLRQWNYTDRDAFQVNVHGGSPNCQYAVVVMDDRRNVVRQEFVLCSPTFVPFEFLAGSCQELAFELPLAALNAENGLVDGEPLPPGVYLIEAVWSRQGPLAAPDLVAEGGNPRAAVSVRVLD